MEIRQVRYVVAIADTGTFTAAAERCFVAQPSLSQSVRRLERELGVELFHRAGSTRLTAAGEAFVSTARVALRAFDAIAVEVAAVRGVLTGELDLVALPTLAVDPLAPLLSRFRAAHPGVTIRVAHPEGTADLLARITRGERELGLTEMPRGATSLVTIPFGRQEIVAVLPPGAPAPTAVRPGELARFPLVTQPPGTSTRQLLDELFERHHLSADIAVETDQRELILPMVSSGGGAAVLPRSFVDGRAAGNCRVVPFRPALWRQIALVHRREGLTPAGRAFRAIAEGWAGARPSPPPEDRRGDAGRG